MNLNAILKFDDKYSGIFAILQSDPVNACSQPFQHQTISELYFKAGQSSNKSGHNFSTISPRIRTKLESAVTYMIQTEHYRREKVVFVRPFSQLMTVFVVPGTDCQHRCELFSFSSSFGQMAAGPSHSTMGPTRSAATLPIDSYCLCG